MQVRRRMSVLLESILWPLIGICSGKVTGDIPSMLDYRNHIANGSMLNTPPVFAVYVCMLTLRWLKNMGGVAEIEQSITGRKRPVVSYD